MTNSDAVVVSPPPTQPPQQSSLHPSLFTHMIAAELTYSSELNCATFSIEMYCSTFSNEITTVLSSDCTSSELSTSWSGDISLQTSTMTSFYTDHTASIILPSPLSLKALSDSSIVETVESLYKSPTSSVILTSETVTNQTESISLEDVNPTMGSSLPEVFQNSFKSDTLQVPTTTTAEVTRTATVGVTRTTTAVIPSANVPNMQKSTYQVFIAEIEERTKEKVSKHTSMFMNNVCSFFTDREIFQV